MAPKPKIILGFLAGAAGVLGVTGLIFAQQPAYQLYLSFEASNYAPAEYRSHARTLPVTGSSLVFSADLFRRGAAGTLLPQNPANYIFEWTWRRHPVRQTGKNVFQASLPDIPDNPSAVIGVKVIDRFSDITVASKELSIPIASPEVMVYEVRPNGSVGSLSLESFAAQPGETLTFLAQPYFFTLPSDADALEYVWRHGGAPIEGVTTDPRFLNVKIPGNQSNYRESFSVNLANKFNVLEAASRSFGIEVK